MNELQTVNANEAANIANEAMSDAGFLKMIKFKKLGETAVYLCDGEEIELGSQRIAHCVGWTKQWVKFWDNKVAERRIYRVAKGERAPERDELPDYDEESRKKWQIGLNNQPRDPWVLQYLLPLEDPETEEIAIFVTGSFGGRRAVADICSTYARKAQRVPEVGQPLVRLQKTMMPTRNFGNVARPEFVLIGYSDYTREPRRDVPVEALEQADDMNDEIPF